MKLRNVVRKFGSPARQAVGGTALVLASSAAMAADTTEVQAEIVAAGVSVAEIGAAVLLIAVGIAVYKWIRRAL